jgi:hypothetical protein
MAFTGTPVFEQISDRCVRLTGVSLAASTTGSVGLFGTTVPGAIALPDAFNPKAYDYGSNLVSLGESIRATVNATGITPSPATAVPVRVNKAGGTPPHTFAVTFINDDSAAATAGLEIYIEFRD